MPSSEVFPSPSRREGEARGPMSMDEARQRIEKARVMLDRAAARGIVLDAGPLPAPIALPPKDNGSDKLH